MYCFRKRNYYFAQNKCKIIYIMPHYDYLIVGSGLYGTTFAYKAKQAGKKVLVIENVFISVAMYIVSPLRA